MYGPNSHRNPARQNRVATTTAPVRAKIKPKNSGSSAFNPTNPNTRLEILERRQQSRPTFAVQKKINRLKKK